MKNPTKPKILIYDIECTGHLGYSYSLWDARLHKIIEYPIMLSFSYTWYEEGGKQKIINLGLIDYKSFEKDRKNDRELIQDLWSLFDEADFTLGHNSYSFDDKMARMFFIKHKMSPTSPVRSIDTKRMAKSLGRFGSNSLQYLSEFFGTDGKEKVTHADLWWDCLLGDKKAWRLMKKYNGTDVQRTVEAYEILRPWMSNHPTMSRYTDNPDSCPRCGEQDKLQRRGFIKNNTSVYRRYQCQVCKGWFKRRAAEGKHDDIKPSFSNV